MIRPTFEDALMDLIDKEMRDGTPLDEIISTMELRIMALNEQEEGA